MEEITLDVIPIYKNEIFPTKNEYMHFVNKKEESICKRKTLEHMIQQISDLFYHVFVLMNNQGVSLDDVENKLKERHKITENKKEFHTRGEY